MYCRKTSLSLIKNKKGTLPLIWVESQYLTFVPLFMKTYLQQNASHQQVLCYMAHFSTPTLIKLQL